MNQSHRFFYFEDMMKFTENTTLRLAKSISDLIKNMRKTVFHPCIHEQKLINTYNGFTISCSLHFNNKVTPRTMSVYGRYPTARQFKMAARLTRSQQK